MLTVSCIYQLSTKSVFYVIMEHKKKIRHYVLCPMTDLNVKQIQKYPTVEIIQMSNVKIVERAKFGSLAHKYMTADFPVWYRHFNKKWRV